MGLILTSNADVLRKQFYSLEHPRDVAAMLEISYKDLIYYLYRYKAASRYTVVAVSKKSGGVRVLQVPMPSLKILQKKLLQVLEIVYQPKHSTHGFVKDRSILTNAEAHLRRKKRSYILNLDIENFFPSINFGRVRGMFIAAPYYRPESVATVLAQICCINNELPQGSPVSPIIANMICSRLDSQLQYLAQEHRCFYTRYADDLTFSTSVSSFPRTLAQVRDMGAGQQMVIGNTLSEIIRSNGFNINQDKIRLQSADRRQEVTGITVNKVPNVSRKFINQIRAMLHAWEKYGYEQAEQEHFKRWKKAYSSPFVPQATYSAILRGKIEYIGMIRGTQNRTYRQFIQKLQQLDPTLNKIGLSDSREQIFISYSHQDADWLEQLKIHLKPLERQGKIVTWEDTKIVPGSKWRQEIEKALNSAKAAVLLVSPSFLASDFIHEHELPPLLKAAEKDGLKILWIAVSYSSYRHTPINDYQAAHDPQEPLDSLSKSEVNRALVDICEVILAVASSI